MTEINCHSPSDVKLNLPVDTQSFGDGRFFQSVFSACINPEDCSHTPDIHLQSVRFYRHPAGWREARGRETNRNSSDTKQQNMKVKRNTSHQFILLLLQERCANSEPRYEE
ncbi:hypothetical protein PBY51_009809 [Eleginops maclovinus]|uniref:Uncharacterized protein n=1 Tax=Eleginops maclovinus TaxID=56733 RepID=A0AAN7XZK7_ELEMC|nr:hypothetical protein PBY51_009809 [Eleginops maclovinus]